MKTMKKIIAMVLVMSLVWTGLYVVPEMVEAADTTVTEVAISNGKQIGSSDTYGFESKGNNQYYLWAALGDTSIKLADSLGLVANGYADNINVIIDGVSTSCQVRVNTYYFAIVLNDFTTKYTTVGTNITIPKGTEIKASSSSAVFKLSENFTYHNNDGSTWEKLASKEMTFSSVQSYDSSAYWIRLRKTDGGLPTDENIFFHKITAYINGESQELQLRTIKDANLFQVVFDSTTFPTIEKGLEIRIPAGTSLIPSNTDGYKTAYPAPYVITEEFVSYYDGEQWVLGVYDSAVELSIAGADMSTYEDCGIQDRRDENVGFIVWIQTDTLLTATSDVASDTKFDIPVQVDGITRTYTAQPSAKGFFVRWNANYTVHEGITFVIPAGTRLTDQSTGNDIFKITNSYNLKYNGYNWMQVSDSEVEIPEITISGLTNTSTYPDGLQNRLTDGTDAMYLWLGLGSGFSFADYFEFSGIPTMTSKAKFLVNGEVKEYNVRFEASKLAIVWPEADFTQTTDDVDPETGLTFTIPKGTVLSHVVDEVTYEFVINQEWSYRYNGVSWEQHVNPTIPMKLTLGEGSTETALVLNSNVNTDIAPFSFGEGQTLDISGANEFSNATYASGNQISFTVSASEGSKVILPKGLRFHADGYVFELSETFRTTYTNGAWVENTQEVQKIHITKLNVDNTKRDGAAYISLDTDATGFTSGKQLTISDSIFVNGKTYSSFGTCNAYIFTTGIGTIRLNISAQDAGTIYTVAAGFRFQLADNDTVYEVAETYSVRLDYTNDTYTFETMSVADPIHMNVSGVSYSAASMIGLTVDTAFVTDYNIPAGQVLKTDHSVLKTSDGATAEIASDSYTAAVDSDGKLFLSFDNETFVTGDTITIPAGMQFTYGSHVITNVSAFTLTRFANEWLLDETDGWTYTTVTTEDSIRSQTADTLQLNTDLEVSESTGETGVTVYYAYGVLINGVPAQNISNFQVTNDKKVALIKFIENQYPSHGDVLTIPKGLVLVNRDNSADRLYFEKEYKAQYWRDHWVVDKTGPVVTYDNCQIANGDVLDSIYGQISVEDFASRFAAVDSITGETTLLVTVTKSDSTDTITTLQGGNTYTVTLTPGADAYGNTSESITVTITIEQIKIANGHEKDGVRDQVINVLDLVDLLKLQDSKDYDTYDLNADMTIDATDSQYMRELLVGKREIVAGQVVMPVYDESQEMALFANWPPNQSDSTALSTYFGAGFTHIIMTEDHGLSIGTDGYNGAVSSILASGNNVIIRNREDYASDYLTKYTDTYSKMGADIFYYWDEPTVTEMTGTNFQGLITYHNTYNTDTKFLSVLLPSESITDAGATDYADYLSQYQTNVLKKVTTESMLFMDHYPLRTQTTGAWFWEQTYNIIQSTYLSDLLAVSNLAKEHNASSEHKTEVGFYIQAFSQDTIRGIASAADIDFQVNTALAMGAKNIAYFRYDDRGDTSSESITENDTTYQAIKEANSNLKKWDHVLKSYDWQGVKTVNGSVSVSGTSQTSSRTAMNAITGLSSLEKVTEVTATYDAIVGEFQDVENGYYGYMVTNFTEPSLGTSTTVKMTFDSSVKNVLVYSDGGARKVQLTDSVYEATLQAGAGVFVIPL